MTSSEANKINLEIENDPKILRGLVKFWQDKASEAIKAEEKISNVRTLIRMASIENIDTISIQKITDIIDK